MQIYYLCCVDNVEKSLLREELTTNEQYNKDFYLKENKTDVATNDSQEYDTEDTFELSGTDVVAPKRELKSDEVTLDIMYSLPLEELTTNEA